MLQAPDFSHQLVTQQAVIATVVTAQAVRERSRVPRVHWTFGGTSRMVH